MASRDRWVLAKSSESAFLVKPISLFARDSRDSHDKGALTLQVVLLPPVSSVPLE